MPVCAMVNLSTMKVDNMIMADGTNPVPDGFTLIVSPPDHVTIGTGWDGVGFDPPPLRIGIDVPSNAINGIVQPIAATEIL